MTTSHNLGFPRIGPKRELKLALEAYWNGQSSLAELNKRGVEMRRRVTAELGHSGNLPHRRAPR